MHFVVVVKLLSAACSREDLTVLTRNHRASAIVGSQTKLAVECDAFRVSLLSNDEVY